MKLSIPFDLCQPSHLIIDHIQSKNADGVDFFLEATGAKPKLFFIEWTFFLLAPVVVARGNPGEDMAQRVNVPGFLQTCIPSLFETVSHPYPLSLVTQGIEFYDIEAQGKIASVEEQICEEEMTDDDGKVEEFTEDEADEIVGVPAT